MPLFKIDDKRIKKIIKDAVGAKEGDFNGQSMLMGTTVNPVVIVNNVPKSFEQLYVNVTAVQNTWYTVCDIDVPVRIYSTGIAMATLAEDLEVRLTLNGVEYTDTQAGAVAGTWYYPVLVPNSILGAINLQTTDNSATRAFWLEVNSFKYEIRKTSANGANTLTGATWVFYK